eukprot:7238104-Pyramimonas_sp.AAC.1
MARPMRPAGLFESTPHRVRALDARRASDAVGFARMRQRESTAAWRRSQSGRKEDDVPPSASPSHP